MRILLLLLALAGSSTAIAQETPVFYSYEGDSGRTVYVNRFSMVPPEKRSQVRAIDLSEVELHQDLAEGLAEAVEDELRYLKESDPCNEARTEVKLAKWRHAWNRHGSWILASLAAIALVFMTPWMVGRTPPGVWSRLLMVALPALAMTALLAYSATRVTASLEAVSELVKLCDANEQEASPSKQLVRLNEMHTYIDQLYEDQYREIERLGDIE